MIIVCSLKDLETTCESIKPSHVISVIDPGYAPDTPKGVKHVFLAINDCTLVVMLTIKWDDCEKPIVHQNLGMGKGDHGDPESPYYEEKNE